MTSIYSRLGEFVTDIEPIFSAWNEHVYVFNEGDYQLSGYARAQWALSYAPIPPLKGLRTTTQNAKLVLATIAQRSNQEYGGAWPGVSIIAGETGLSKRAVRYTLDVLQALGLIEDAPHRAQQCPPYLSIPADKRPRFYTVNFVLDKRIVTDEYRQWADEQLDELRRKRVRRSTASGTTTDERGATQNTAGCNVEHERGATQNTTGCNVEHSGVQRVAANKSIKTNKNSNILKK